ncbi:MotE family protein [Dankookia sp. GCM10030260]|uniref:MotE family protein n=1 Tax=Dankookia sp. GCM10030260 TaxID=3273390 RepID=UPI00361D4BDC
MRPRLLPAALAAMALLLAAKLQALVTQPSGPLPALGLVAPARASSEPSAAARAAAPAVAPARPLQPVPPEPPSPEQAAERAVLEGLRARRGELEAREQAMAAREMMLAAAEKRLAQRIDELGALQQRLQSFDRTLGEREEAGWRQMVKLYEGMRPRDAAVIFDDLDPPVLLQILDRMGERKAAPVLGAMKPDRARSITAELARHRARPVD